MFGELPRGNDSLDLLAPWQLHQKVRSDFRENSAVALDLGTDRKPAFQIFHGHFLSRVHVAQAF